jgi:D-alanine-D-alanine ligase
LSNKISVGIIFGGASREREISFAGGRTVYDNLNKSLFDAVPLFVDSFGNFILLNWQYVYKGSIRDFYPPVHTLPESINDFQIYAESIGGLSIQQQKDLSIGLGTIIEPHQLKEHIDVAFLALHGPVGEDGTIQGLLEYLKIPYTGSGILASAIGIDKAIQKQMMVNAGFASPQFFVIEKEKWTSTNYQKTYEKAVAEIGFPLVVKAAKQGSSIGISILKEANYDAFIDAVNKSLFCKKINVKDWSHLSSSEKINELIHRHYRFMGYRKFANYIQQLKHVEEREREERAG